MNQPKNVASADTRREPRVSLDEDVTIEIAAVTIVGSGQNISPQGVFFTADGALPVNVRISGRPDLLSGQLVRLESMGGGRIGIAVRFDESRPDLMPS